MKKKHNIKINKFGTAIKVSFTDRYRRPPEGIWQQNARGRWQHVKGGIRQPLTTGDAVLRWEPFQVFILASIYGFHAWIPTGVSEEEKPDLLPSERVRGHWVEIYPHTLCQQTDMEDADGIKIWENDILRLSPFGKPESQYTGDVVWLQTCFAVEDDRGHTEPLCTLRNLCKIEVIGNRYDEG